MKYEMPICPICKQKMTPRKTTGWDIMLYWTCNCIDNENWPKGVNWEYGITIH